MDGWMDRLGPCYDEKKKKKRVLFLHATYSKMKRNPKTKKKGNKYIQTRNISGQSLPPGETHPDRACPAIL